jgi:hypothetical protein
LRKAAPDDSLPPRVIELKDAEGRPWRYPLAEF